MVKEHQKKIMKILGYCSIEMLIPDTPFMHDHIDSLVWAPQ